MKRSIVQGFHLFESHFQPTESVCSYNDLDTISGNKQCRSVLLNHLPAAGRPCQLACLCYAKRRVCCMQVWANISGVRTRRAANTSMTRRRVLAHTPVPCAPWWRTLLFRVRHGVRRATGPRQPCNEAASNGGTQITPQKNTYFIKRLGKGGTKAKDACVEQLRVASVGVRKEGLSASSISWIFFLIQ